MKKIFKTPEITIELFNDTVVCGASVYPTMKPDYYSLQNWSTFAQVGEYVTKGAAAAKDILEYHNRK